MRRIANKTFSDHVFWGLEVGSFSRAAYTFSLFTGHLWRGLRNIYCIQKCICFNMIYFSVESVNWERIPYWSVKQVLLVHHAAHVSYTQHISLRETFGSTTRSTKRYLKHTILPTTMKCAVKVYLMTHRKTCQVG